MTDLTLEIDDDEDDFEDDDYIFDEDDWEDSEFPLHVKDRFPDYYMLKIRNFSSRKLVDIDTWCKYHLTNGKYERVGWRSGCSTSVGIVIEDATDAMMFKLAWSE